MSITDELREYALSFVGGSICAKLDAIADRIDANHISEVGQTRSKAWNEGFDEGFASTDDLSTASEENMAKHGWIRLPRDADNKIVNIGDKLDGYNKTIEVMWLRLGSTGWWIIDKYGESYACCDAFSHHHELTVEDVLEEYRIRYYDLVTDMECKNITNEEYVHGISSLNAEYAAKLQLKEQE